MAWVAHKHCRGGIFSLIRHLLELIPTLPTVLQPILLKHFPWKKESEVEYVTYIRNVLDVVEYCSEVSGKVWEGVIDRLIRLDVSGASRSLDAGLN
jgi:RNA polymerase I-specific transcription initiation factor RRN3